MGKRSNYSTFMLSKLSSSAFLKLYSLSYIINADNKVYGMQIIEHIKSFNTSWNPSHGTLYPILNQMVDEGLIICTHEDSHYDSNKKQRKKYYEATEWGVAYYNSKVDQFKDTIMKSANFYSTIARELNKG